MALDLTPAVTRALEAAQLLAQVAGATHVQLEHLLGGLLEDEEGQPAVLLTRAGLDLTTLRSRFRCAWSGSKSAKPVPPGEQLQDVLVQAGSLARGLAAEGSLASDVLLLALLQSDPSLRCHLEGLGLVYDQLEADVLGESRTLLHMDEPLQLLQPTEQVDTARILDASANRAREALRVLEDFCRFALDDALLSRELKELRHGLADALGSLSASLLLQSRETLRDVGTVIATEQEAHRHGLIDVAEANCKRLQEALRSLEEYGKIHSPSLGEELERLRYRSYTLERMLLLGTTARHRLANARLQVLVSSSLCAAALDWTIREAAAGGADVIQLREKHLSDRELLARARRVRQWTREVDVLFIVNDRPDIARLAEADGVHLGQDDLPVKEARRVLGPDALIGVSTHDLDQVRQAVLDGASYLGVGPTFTTSTKRFAEYPGLEFVQAAMAETSLPAFAIGGVTAANVAEVAAVGCRRVAVSAAICKSDQPGAVAAAIRAML